MIHDELLNFDKRLTCKFMGLDDIQQIIAVGRIGEREKAELIVSDIEAKSARISDILVIKE